MLYRYRAGVPRRDPPERFDDPINLRTRLSAAPESGVWKKVFEIPAADADNEYVIIDSTIVRTSTVPEPKKDGKDQAIGRSKGGLSTKLHAMVDASGNPPRFS